MLKSVSGLATVLVLSVQAVQAATGGAIPLPDVSQLDRPQAETLVRKLAEINVITSNCADWAISDAEWTLITGTGDLLAAQLGLDPATYDKKYYGPAFALLDDPGACDRIGPEARPMIDRLEAMGSSAKAATGPANAEEPSVQ